MTAGVVIGMAGMELLVFIGLAGGVIIGGGMIRLITAGAIGMTAGGGGKILKMSKKLMFITTENMYLRIRMKPSPAQSQIQTFNSKDGSRMVKLAGNSHDAFLYDTSEKAEFKAKYLASGVTDVRFSNTDNGKPLQIMLSLSDGTFELYDADGNPVGGN